MLDCLEGGFSGDKGLATSAQFRAPQGVVSGPEGSLYIVDTGNNRVRRVGADGFVDTIPGGFLTESVKQIVVDNDGVVAYLDSFLSVVRVVRANGVPDVIAGARLGSTPALRASLNLVGQSGIALVPGNLLLGELDGIRAIGLDGSISLLIGNQGASVPIAGLNSSFGIYGIAGDNASGIYFTIPGAISSEQN